MVEKTFKLKNMAEYYILQDGEKRGPYTKEELLSRGISSETLVWCEGMKDWMAAWQVEDLKALLKGEESLASTPPPIPKTNTQSTPIESYKEEVENRPKKKKKNHSGCIVIIVILIILIALLKYTCPSYDKHKEVVSKEISTAIDESVGLSGGGFLGMVTNFLTSGVVNVAINEILQVDDYFVCSVGKVNYDGKDRIVSFGVFNQVYTIDKDAIKEKIKDYLPAN